MEESSAIDKEENQNINRTKSLNSVKSIEEDLNIIELLPTFNKINLVQILLKEMLSTKGRFDDNKNKMIEKIKFNSYKYYKSIISSREINDNFKSKESERQTYTLINNSSKTIEKGLYNKIYNFLFLLRNNNAHMLKIINRCKYKNIKNLSYFIAHFFYENTINSNNSFIQIELQLIIYFLLEKIIYKNPEELFYYDQKKEEKDKKEKDLEYDSFLYRLLEALIRKPEIGNYLNIILTDLIIQMEKGKNKFILELLKKQVNDGDKSKKQNKNILQKGRIQREMVFLKTYSYKSDISKSLLSDKVEKNSDNAEVKIEKKKTINDIEDITNEDNIDDFFYDNDTTSDYISGQLSIFKSLNEKNKISLAMDYFLTENLTNMIMKAKDNDKYRNNYFFGLLAPEKNEKSEQKAIKDKYIENIKKEYNLLTDFITNLISKMEETISNIPTSIKNILNAADKLIEKKMGNNKEQSKFAYFQLMAKLKIIIGNFILPMINEYYTNRVITEHILSIPTSEALKKIEKIFKAILIGKLFDNNEDPEYTIYNRYIIDIFPRLLNLSLSIEKNNNNNSNTDDNYSKIFQKLINAFEDIKDSNRIIDYNKLQEKDDYNKNQNILFQSICFNWDTLLCLVKTIKEEKQFYIKEDKEEDNNIFEDIINSYNDISNLCKKNKDKRESEYYFIDKIIYKEEFKQKINSIIQDNFEIVLKSEKNQNINRFKKCLSEILGYVGILHEEDFLPFITPKKDIPIYSNTKTNLILNYKKNNLYNKIDLEIDNDDKTGFSNNLCIKNNEEITITKSSFEINYRDRFYTRRKSVVSPIFMFGRNNKNTNTKKDNTDFKSVIFPQIMSLIKTEIGNSFNIDKFQRIIFCSSYIQTQFDKLPEEYTKNDYSKIFTEIISDTKILIQELQNNILNEFFMKIRYAEKNNEILNKDYIHIKNIEKLFYIKCLYKKAKIYGNVSIEDDFDDSIKKIKFEPSSPGESKLGLIKSFLKEIPNITESKTKKEDDFLKMEENIGLVDTINVYFKELKNSIKNDILLCKLTIEEFYQVLYGLENYILKKLYQKFYPTKQSKVDIFIYKKCSRLSFIKPDNIIKDKKFKNINENLLKISIGYVKEMDNNKTPMDKINCFGKALNFLSNSMEFNSGKADFGVDDLLPLLIYIVIKAKPERLYTNYNYCLLYLNRDLNKRQYGSLLTQIGVITNIIKKMKYTDLNNVTKEQFGSDEEI